MQRYKSLVLPVALVAGYFLRELCSIISVSVPYVIFAILFLTFSGVRLSRLRPTGLDLILALIQTFGSLGVYFLTLLISSGNNILAEGAMICVLCPVASSVTVVASMLGADPVRTTTYTIVGNLLVALIAPLYITYISETGEISVLGSFTMIFCKIATVIALPFFVVLLIQKFWPHINEKIARYKTASFYLWAYALFVTIGQTADFVVLRWQGDAHNVFYLGIISLLICAAQFYFGRLTGKRYNDRIAGGQLLAQKNSAMGIWIVNSFLNPIASVAMAFYSIWQNIFNSWQIYRRNSAIQENSGHPGHD